MELETFQQNSLTKWQSHKTISERGKCEERRNKMEPRNMCQCQCQIFLTFSAAMRQEEQHIRWSGSTVLRLEKRLLVSDVTR